MNEKEKFIMLYMDDYVKMAYRKLIGKINLEEETKLVYNIYYLMDIYSDGELNKYIINEEIL